MQRGIEWDDEWTDRWIERRGERIARWMDGERRIGGLEVLTGRGMDVMNER